MLAARWEGLGWWGLRCRPTRRAVDQHGVVLDILVTFRFPVEIIRHCVWLYYRFPLSTRGAYSSPVSSLRKNLVAALVSRRAAAA